MIGVVFRTMGSKRPDLGVPPGPSLGGPRWSRTGLLAAIGGCAILAYLFFLAAELKRQSRAITELGSQNIHRPTPSPPHPSAVYYVVSRQQDHNDGTHSQMPDLPKGEDAEKPHEERN